MTKKVREAHKTLLALFPKNTGILWRDKEDQCSFWVFFATRAMAADGLLRPISSTIYHPLGEQEAMTASDQRMAGHVIEYTFL